VYKGLVYLCSLLFSWEADISYLEPDGRQILLTGWKDIAHAMGLKSERTARKWARKYRMPIVRIEGKPTVIVAVFERWWIHLHEIGIKKKKSVVDL